MMEMEKDEDLSSVLSSSISLTAQERELFDVMLGCLAWKGRLDTTLRVAGGWVRDKLLGKNSSDIDIAIDNQTGVAFATSLNEYLASLGTDSNRIAVIMANPEQSKHMETATVKVLGLPIDFVNLRSEAYTDDTRVPEIQFGTAKEDAYRRDFTINTLFYNINTNTIEDMTEYGIIDLNNKIIRTPLNPFVTFKDDPLRILRAIRFAARYGFNIDHNIIQASQSTEVQDMFHTKISKERILKEIDGMLSHEIVRPALAIRCMYYFGLYKHIFKIPCQDDGNYIHIAKSASLTTDTTVFHEESIPSVIEMWPARSVGTITWFNAVNLLRRSGAIKRGEMIEHIPIDAQIQPLSVLSSPIRPYNGDNTTVDTSSIRGLYLAGATFGLYKLYSIDKKKKELSLPIIILRDSLKLDTETLRLVEMIHQSIPKFHHLSNIIHTHLNGNNNDKIGFSREEVGLILRNTRHHWREILWMACAEELNTAYPLQTSLGGGSTTLAAPISNSTVESTSSTDRSHNTTDIVHTMSDIMTPLTLSSSSCHILHNYAYLEQLIYTWNLDGIWELKPLYDGKQLMSIIGIKMGPLIGALMDAQLRWQLNNPPPQASQGQPTQYTTEQLEQCIAYLKQSI
jgi:tRNA nucleotidyltransferase/poly(A) polymerase